MKKIIIYLSLTLFLIITQFSSNSEKTKLTYTSIPETFVFDGCSMFPDGNYLDCCTNHDKTYYFGGTYIDRFRSDNELFSCVYSKGNILNKFLAPTMWVGVRLGGAPIFPTSYRWGFGRDLK
ncbi:hypothetical protein HUU51_05105 [Candidatus Gracilibacteria bacterium]|nr:hypothetical protein [Candidatus Gracilibacteria bacterium]